MNIKHSNNKRNLAVSASIEGTESLISKFARNVCDALWEDCNIWAEWDKTSEGILISMSDDPDSDTQATFTIPEYELDFDNYDFDDMVDDYVENLQEEFIGSTSSEDIDSATNIPDIQSYYTDDAVSRYIHSLIPEIADLLESEGYDVSFDQDANNLYISIYPSGEDYEDGTYSFPKSALDCEGFNTYTDASNIVEILMNRAHFEDFYACDSITSAYQLNDEVDEACTVGFYDYGSNDEVLITFYSFHEADEYVKLHEDTRVVIKSLCSDNYLNHLDSATDATNSWEYVTSKSVPDSDGFATDYTMYKNTYTGKYICMLGDNDVYEPDEAYADFECDSEAEAYDWFNSYEGFSEDDIYSSSEARQCDSRDDNIYGASRKRKPPKYWDSMFRVRVVDAYKKGELTFDNISEWDTNYNGGVPPKPSLGTKEILQYYVDVVEPTEGSDNVSSATSTSSSSKYYFGQEPSELYGDMIAEKLSGRTISKRKDLGDQPGGLVYEAEQLGIDMWDLLEALEGMCYEGRAREIDDSTYEVLSCQQIFSSTSGQNVIDESQWTSWTDVYALFEDIIDKYLPDEDKIAEEVNKLYNTYRHNRYMRTAYDKWCESGRVDI